MNIKAAYWIGLVLIGIGSCLAGLTEGLQEILAIMIIIIGTNLIHLEKYID